MPADFNLVQDRWIPVYRSDGKNALTSLQDAFTDASIIDLNVDPCERIALTRLLLAIAHRALDQAGQHQEEYIKSEVIRGRLTQCVPGYLDTWKEAFDLGDEQGGFLRLPNVTSAELPETPSAEYLQFQRGSKATHRTLTPNELALGILTFQTCYPGGLCARNLSMKGLPITSVSAQCSPSMEGGPIYAFIIGGTLFDTISRNLLTKSVVRKEFGVPVWEAFSAETFLGRMLPISYSIAFSSGFENMGYGPAPYSYQTEMQDPWLAYRDTPKGSAVVRLNPEKSLWRELPAITAIPEPGKRSGSLFLQQSRNIVGAQVWTGGLAKFQSNIKTLTESRFDLSESVFESLRTEGYLNAFHDAEQMASRLTRAVKTYALLASHPNPKRKGLPGVSEAQMRYWNRLDNSKELLFDLIAKGEDPASWSTHCFQTALNVLGEVCDPTSAREFRALALAQHKLKNS
jgi:hypothetical protein